MSKDFINISIDLHIAEAIEVALVAYVGEQPRSYYVYDFLESFSHAVNAYRKNRPYTKQDRFLINIGKGEKENESNT